LFELDWVLWFRHLLGLIEAGNHEAVRGFVVGFKRAEC
jgi:hypothetical protein